MFLLGFGLWHLMMTGLLLFWLVVAAGIFLIARAIGGHRRVYPQMPPRTDETPMAILERRLVAGDISVEEYERIREALQRAAA